MRPFAVGGSVRAVGLGVESAEWNLRGGICGVESAKTAVPAWKIRSFPPQNRGAPLKAVCGRYEQRTRLSERWGRPNSPFITPPISGTVPSLQPRTGTDLDARDRNGLAHLRRPRRKLRSLRRARRRGASLSARAKQPQTFRLPECSAGGETRLALPACFRASKPSAFSFVTSSMSSRRSRKGATSAAARDQSSASRRRPTVRRQESGVSSSPSQPLCMSAAVNSDKLGGGQSRSLRYQMRS